MRTPNAMAPNRIRSIERAAAVLQLLSGRARRLGVVELPGQLNLPKATVHGAAAGRMPTALGKALLAETPDAWATDHEELVEGEVSYAAAVRDRRGNVVGAIGISGPVERLFRDGAPDTEFVSYVREAARAVSRDLGAIPW